MATVVPIKREFDQEQCDFHSRRTRSLRSFGTSLRRFQYDGQAAEECLGDPDFTLDSGSRRRTRDLSYLPEAGSSRKRTSPAKRTAGYAPPSMYAHLPKLQDRIEHNMICLFIGNNPGVMTAAKGHAYSHPSNLFWKLLHSSGCTDRRCRPEEDDDMPRLYSLGFTNIVERPTKNTAELSPSEIVGGTPVLEDKIRRFRPEAVCIVGKGIWEAIYRHRHGRKLSKDEFQYGWQEDERFNMGVAADDDPRGPWNGAKVFVAPSTSGLAASLSPAQKEEIWGRFGSWVRERRRQRAADAVTIKTEP